MPKVALTNMQGATIGEIELSDELFAAPINTAAVHLVVRSILANKRQGTKSALTRTEVRGGGRKIYRQKGTGNARHHGNRAPQFRHGGVVFAPKPRDFVVTVPRKVRRLALKSVLTSKVQDQEIIVLDQLTLTDAKTRLMAAVESVFEQYRERIDQPHAAFQRSVDVPLAPPRPEGRLRTRAQGVKPLILHNYARGVNRWETPIRAVSQTKRKSARP